mgnify:CR=1 FL=1
MTDAKIKATNYPESVSLRYNSANEEGFSEKNNLAMKKE